MFPRSFLAAVWLALAAYAGPALTTIQDVLYKADGTRFNGTLTISWYSFQSADNSAVATQSTTVKVLDGNLRVQLVPGAAATPPTTYSVVYNSDGRVQFRETWSVPASQQPLRVSQVRVTASKFGRRFDRRRRHRLGHHFGDGIGSDRSAGGPGRTSGERARLRAGGGGGGG